MKYILIILVFFCSCSTTKKTKSFSKSTVDSVSVVKIDSSTLKVVDSVSVKKDNTVTTIEKQNDYEKETIIEFDTTKQSWEKTPTEDYFSPIIKITIKEKGVKKERTNIVQNTSDSTGKKELAKTDLSKNVNTAVKKTAVTNDKKTERTSYWGWLWFLLIPIVWVVGWYFRVWPWLFALLKRNRKEKYPIKYKKK